MKKRKNQKSARRRPKNGMNVVQIPIRKRRVGELGIFDRNYPAAIERKRIVESIRSKPEPSRGPDEWWMLGEFLVYDGLMDEDDGLVNEGIQALTRGSEHPTPSPACMLDLAWILMHKGLDGLALTHLEKAVQLAPKSRDAWSLKGLCHIGNLQRDAAIDSYEHAVHLPNATEGDREILESLRQGENLKDLRRRLFLRKMEPDFLGRGRYSPEEEAKVTCHILGPLLESQPNNPDLLYAIAHARYVLGQFGRARPLLYQLNELTGGHAGAYTLLGLIAKRERNNRDAERDFYRGALDADPNHLLALVNLASSLQETGEYHAARPLVERAVHGDERDPNFAIALDLLGSNIGVLDEDFEEEARLHDRAARLNPHYPNFRANHVISLLSAGKAKEARAVFLANKAALRSISNFDLLTALVDAYTRDLGHPYAYMQIIEGAHKLLGWKALGPLVRKAWAQRGKVTGHPEEQLGFHSDLAIFAGRAGLRELALEIWGDGASLPGGEALICNQAVELSEIGRHGEALDLAERMPMVLPRAYTVRGNIRRSAGMHLAAVESYREALQHDEMFLLPISNAINCIEAMCRPELLPPFIDAIDRNWSDNSEARLLKARSLLLSGHPNQAAELYRSVLERAGALLDPDEIQKDEDADDPTIWGREDGRHHKAFGSTLILAGRHGEFEQLYGRMAKWPKWFDGDWKVLLAESRRYRGDLIGVEAALQGTQTQAPPSITRALCCLGRGDFSGARRFAEEALGDPRGAAGYSHLEGRPDAVGTAILAMVCLDEGGINDAVNAAKTAVADDVGCAIARTSLASALQASGEQESAIQILVEGLERTPGRPALVRMAIEAQLQLGRCDEANELLTEHRDMLKEYGVPGLGERLGEIVALARLERRGTRIDLPANGFSWTTKLDEKSRSWIASAVAIRSSGLPIGEAQALYLSKVAEREMFIRLFEPFIAKVVGGASLTTDLLQELSRYLDGGRPPALGGMIRGLILANMPFRSNEPRLVTELRNFLKQLPAEFSTKFRNGSFLERLRDLGSARNAVAHVGDPDPQQVDVLLSLILDGDQPGELLRALIPDIQNDPAAMAG